MKWVLVVALISVIMLIAYAVSEQYKDKFDFYNNLKQFLNQFKINVSFKQEKINEFLSKLNSRKYFKLFISDYQNYLTNNSLELENIKILDEEEKTELKEIVTNIGRFDTRNEIGQLDNFTITIDNRLLKAEKDKNKICPMIIKLSLLFAIGLAILLI